MMYHFIVNPYSRTNQGADIWKKIEKVLLVAAMIQKYEGGGLKMAPSADPSDGKLTLCIIHDINRFLTFFLMPTTLLGKHMIFPMVDMIHCSHCEINAHTPCRVHTDGENYGMESHIIFSSKEQQIRMPH